MHGGSQLYATQQIIHSECTLTEGSARRRRMFEEHSHFHVTAQEETFLFHHEIAKAHGEDMRDLSSISGPSAMREGNPIPMMHGPPISTNVRCCVPTLSANSLIWSWKPPQEFFGTVESGTQHGQRPAARTNIFLY